MHINSGTTRYAVFDSRHLFMNTNKKLVLIFYILIPLIPSIALKFPGEGVVNNFNVNVCSNFPLGIITNTFSNFVFASADPQYQDAFDKAIIHLCYR